MDVVVTDSVLVKPAKPTPHHQLWVASIDLVAVRFHPGIVYFFRRPPNADSDATQILKDALSKVLVDFYPLAGRLIVDASGRIAIDCNEEGVLVVEAITDSVIDDFEDVPTPSQISTLVPSATYDENGFSTDPVCMIQITKFKCGGVSLSTAVQHIVTDGASSLLFVNNWCDIARGLPVKLLPHLDRSPLQARNPPKVSFSHEEFAPPPTLLHQEKDDNIILKEEGKKVSLGTFKISKEQVKALKDKASENPLNKAYSTYVSLAAHIWKCCTTARGLLENQRCKLSIPVDGRGRLCMPPLPSGYFGNAIFTATPIGIAGEIVSNPLWYTAEKIHQSISQMNDEYLRSHLDFLESQPDLNAFIGKDGVFKCPNMSITCWTSLPFYDADFGWGRPTMMAPATARPDGICLIMSSPSNDGSIIVSVSLFSDAMLNFSKMLYDF